MLFSAFRFRRKRIVDVLNKKYAIAFNNKREFLEFYYCIKEFLADRSESILQLKFVPLYCLSVDGEFIYSNKHSLKKIGYKILIWREFDEYGRFMFNALRFIKDDLKNGDLCVFENGDLYIAITDIGEFGALVGRNDTVSMFFLNDVLVFNMFSPIKIIKVYRPQHATQCNLINDPSGKLVYEAY